VSLTLRDARLADGSRVDVRIDGELIAEVGPELARREGAPEHDLRGMLLLPAPVEPHAHLDKALLADRVPNPRGDLLTAIEQMHAHYDTFTVADIAERAERAALVNLACGATAIRTHVDVNGANGLRSVEALVAVRERIGHLVDIELVALVRWPDDEGDGRPGQRLLQDAVAAGVDVIGGCPHLEPDPAVAVRTFVDVAGELERPLDLHTDETLDPDVLTLRDLAETVLRTGFRHGVTASHCVSLGVQPVGVQRDVAALVAAAGITVVALPQTNLFLQARGVAVSPPRGLTGVRALLDAGASLAAGADNLQDPFNTMGRGDPLETAALMVMAGHATPEEAYAMVSVAARSCLGSAPVAVRAGSRAELLAIDAPTLRAAVAFAPMTRLVVHRGRVVSHTVVTTR